MYSRKMDRYLIKQVKQNVHCRLLIVAYSSAHCRILSTFLFEYFHSKMFKRNKILKPTSQMCTLRMSTN